MLDQTDTPRVTLAEIAVEARASLSTVSKVLNGRADVSAATRGRVEELLARHGYRRRQSSVGDVGLADRAGVPRTRCRLVDGDHQRRRGCRARERHERRAHRERKPPRPRRRLDRRGAATPPVRRRAGLLGDPRPVPRGAEGAQHPVRHHRPGRRSDPRRAVRRVGELVGRPDGDPPPDRTRAHPHRRDHRARRHDVFARPHRRLPLGDDGGRTHDRSRLDPLRRLPHRGRTPARPRPAQPRRPSRPRSSPAAISRLSA